MVGQGVDALGIILMHISISFPYVANGLKDDEVRNSEECADFQQGASALKAMHVQSE